MYDENYGNQPVLQDISRQRKLADQLRAQGQEQLNGQMVSGHYIAPSWTQHLAKMLQSYQAGSIGREADKQEKDYGIAKRKAMAEALSPELARATQQGTTDTSTMPAYEPSQMDRFGSPQQGVERQPVVTSTPNMVTESPEQVQARQRQKITSAAEEYGYTPALQLAMGDLNHLRDRTEMLGDKTVDQAYADNRESKLHTRDRGEHVADVATNQAFTTGERVAGQDYTSGENVLNRNQQSMLQRQSLGAQAQQNALSRGASAEQGRLSREQQLMVAGLKNGAGTQVQKANDANDVLKILKQADPLVKTATSSGLGNIYDKSYAFFGGSSEGANDAAQLKALEGNLVSKMPKMAGPQSDKDVLMYKQMAGQIGDPTIPVEQKQAAMEAIREINSRYAGVPYEQQNIMPKGETMPNQDAGYAAWKAKNGK